MRIEAHNNSTGERFTAEAPNFSEDTMRDLLSIDLSDDAVRRMIDNLSISADGKSALYSMSKLTIRVGKTIVYIGKKILDVIDTLLREFPNASFGLIFGGLVGFLASSVPVVGFLLGPLIAPIALALGLIVGAYQDIHDKALARRVASINASFSSLQTN